MWPSSYAVRRTCCSGILPVIELIGYSPTSLFSEYENLSRMKSVVTAQMMSPWFPMSVMFRLSSSVSSGLFPMTTALDRSSEAVATLSIMTGLSERKLILSWLLR